MLPGDDIKRHRSVSYLFQIMARRLVGARPLPGPMLTYRSAVDKLKFMGGPPDHPLWKMSLPNHFLVARIILTYL